MPAWFHGQPVRHLLGDWLGEAPPPQLWTLTLRTPPDNAEGFLSFVVLPGRAAEGATCYGLNLMCQVPEHEAVQAMFCRNMCRCLFPRGAPRLYPRPAWGKPSLVPFSQRIAPADRPARQPLAQTAESWNGARLGPLALAAAPRETRGAHARLSPPGEWLAILARKDVQNEDYSPSRLGSVLLAMPMTDAGDLLLQAATSPVLNEVKQPQARPGIEEVTGKCLLKQFGRVSPFPPHHVSHSSRLFSHSAPGSPSPRGSPCTSQASRKACLHSLSSSNFLFNPLLPDLFCSVERLSLSHAAGQPCPWHAGRNLVGSAGEPDGRGGRSPRRSATLHPAFLPDARLASRAQRCASPLLPGSGRSRHLEFSTEETSTRDPAPSGFQIGRLGRKCPCELGGPSKGRGKNAGRGTSLSNGLRAPMTFAHPLEMSGKQNGQIFCLQSFRLSLFKFFIVWD
ncbi:uncharacterized protein LOC122468125 [Prionailurus bengalensis]|uniref:uncharacterized protein LOC122468125 n=1 Tax=Prionailurus bengalensis TaxID=37029 RepID=UPI001CA7C0B1|nr:uncharacterized protein LOC122468125 [Prionailurus bengalensis]